MDEEYEKIEMLTKSVDLDNMYHIYYDKFAGKKSFKIKTFYKEINGFVKVNVSNAQNLQFKIDNVLIATLNGNVSKFINVVWSEYSVFEIEGMASNLSIYLTNISNSLCNNMDILPLDKSLLMDCGGEYCLFSYDSYENIINNSLTLLKTFDNVCACSPIFLDNKPTMCVLYRKQDGVYLCTKKDNYTSELRVVDNVTDIVIVPKQSDGLYIVYIKSNKLYYKEINNNLELGEEILINHFIKYRPVKLEHTAFYDFGLSLFCVRWENRVVSIFGHKSNSFELLTSLKTPSCSLYVFGTIVYSVARYKSKVVIYKYFIEEYDGYKKLCFDNCYSLNNVSDCFVIEDKLLFKKDEVYTVIDQSIV